MRAGEGPTARAVARRSGSSFLPAFLFLDPERRRALEAVYAFCRKVDDIADAPGADPAAAAGELAAAQAEAARAWAGRAATSWGEELGRAAARFGLDLADLEAVVAGCAMDLAGARFASFAGLELYCRRVASAVGRMCVAIFGVAGPEGRAYADATGLALQLTNILRDVGEDLRRGRVYLPAEDLERFGLAEGELLEAGKEPRRQALFRFEAERARAWFGVSDALLPWGERRRLLPAEIMKEVYRELLRRLERRGPAAWSGPKVRLGRGSRLWVALRTWIRCRLGRRGVAR